MFQSMEIRRKTEASALHRVIESIFFCTLFALPWINLIRVSTFLLLLTGCMVLFTGLLNTDYSVYRKQFVFGIWAVYFLLQVIAFFRYTGDYNSLAIQQKASLIAMPLLLYVLISNYEHVWRYGIMGFLFGNVIAALVCFIVAIIQYIHTHNAGVFFYHQYSKAIGLSAIYFSFYLLIALGYIVSDKSPFNRYWARILGTFLYLNLLLLSSKISIIIGSLLLLILLFRSIKSVVPKVAVIVAGVCIFITLFITANPIKKRFTDVNINSYSSVLTMNNFTDYHFDGLSLRLVFWRLGYGLMKEKGLWLIGDGGQHYHQDFSEKIKAYHLYAGNGTPSDTGYLSYNMHNQYMETYLQFGIVGLLLLLSFLLYVLAQAIYYKRVILIYTIILFTLVFLTESVLETQSGILLFTIIISGEWILLQKKKHGKEM